MANQFDLQFNDQGGNNDPGDGTGVAPSAQTAQRGTPGPEAPKNPKPSIPLIGSPIIGTPMVTQKVILGQWSIFEEDDKLWVSNGTNRLQFVMMNPGGLEQTSKPNKLSDGSDGSSEPSTGNTAATGRTLPNTAINNPATGNQTELILATLRTRESSNNYKAQATTSSASGAYQFINSTWETWSARAGYPGTYQRAKDAPPEVQDAVARTYVNDILRRSGGDINAVPNEWFTGNIYGNMTAKQIAANPTVNSAKYRSNFFSTYNSLGGSTNTALAYAPTSDTGTPATPVAFRTMTQGSGFVENKGSPSATNQVAEQSNTVTTEQVVKQLSGVPCLPPDIADALNQLRPGGLTGLVLDLSSVTGELSKITKQITNLLPGVPFSVTGQIIQQFANGFKGLTGELNQLTGELTGGIDQIVSELNCITQDLTSVGNQINSLLNGLTTTEFIKILPPNLSVDEVINSKANDSLFSIDLAPQTSSLTNQLPGVNTVDSLLPPTNEVISTAIQDPDQQPVEIASLSNPVFVSTVITGRPTVANLLDIEITDQEWDKLIAVTHHVAGDSIEEPAWFIRTVINRSLKSGLAVGDVLDQFIQQYNLDWIYQQGPDSARELLINQSIRTTIESVPDNNYYFEIKEQNASQLPKKRGIVGMAIGNSVVFPGAKWP